MNSLSRLVQALITLFSRLPESFIAFVARFGLAGTFWLAGQTKIEGFKINFITGTWEIGLPQLSENAIFLFEYEYQLPLINATLAAALAALAEHLFALMLLLGLGSRLAALGLLVMTLVIQIFVYPDAWPTHGIWAGLLMYLLARGPGVLSLDHLVRIRLR